MKEVKKIQRIKELEELIDFHYESISHLKNYSQTYKQGARMIRELAVEYKELTGKWYTKKWENQ